MVASSETVAVLQGAEPFRFDAPGDLACLLVHGFTGSPNELRELGRFLAERGVSVRGPLLSGHGTQPSDLTHCSYKDWITEVEAELDALLAEGKRVFLAGLSMGGTLALNVAARRSGQAGIAGVISLAAPVRLVDWRLQFLPIVSLFRRWQRWGDPDICDRSAWDRHVAYQVFHLHGVTQLVRLVRDTRTRLPQIRQPLLVVHSRQDHTVGSFNAELIHRRAASETRRLVWLENSYHVITLDYDAERVRSEVLAFIREQS